MPVEEAEGEDRLVKLSKPLEKSGVAGLVASVLKSSSSVLARA